MIILDTLYGSWANSDWVRVSVLKETYIKCTCGLSDVQRTNGGAVGWYKDYR